MLKPTATITARDLKEALKRVRDTEPDLRKQFVKDIRSIAKEAESPIKQAIRGVTPLSGMRFNYGATGWGVKFAPDATQIRVNAKTGGRSLTTSLVSIKLKSAAASIVDMAGRSGKSIGRGKRNSGLTPVVRRTASGDLVAYARRTPYEAGRKFIANLNRASGILKTGASRIAWPAVEQDLPQFEKRINKSVGEFYRDANRGIL
jgi:hypothetical protein